MARDGPRTLTTIPSPIIFFGCADAVPATPIRHASIVAAIERKISFLIIAEIIGTRSGHLKWFLYGYLVSIHDKGSGRIDSVTQVTYTTAGIRP